MKELPVYAARIRELRQAASLTQEQLAERAGLALGGLRKIEQGEREPSWATLTALADALGVPLDDFRQEPGDRTPQPLGRPAKPKAQASSPKRARGRPKKDSR